MRNDRRPFAMLLTASLAFALSPGANIGSASAARGVKCPDLTRGGKIPDGWTHDWNLGPTGVRGWMYSDTGVTTDARQIQITKVDKGSPADGVLQVGDVITGVRGKPFNDDPRILFGKAITEAEKTVNRGLLRLLVWRKGKVRTVIVKLQPLGTYSLTAPYKCLKSKRIIERGCKAIAGKMKAKPTDGHIIARPQRDGAPGERGFGAASCRPRAGQTPVAIRPISRRAHLAVRVREYLPGRVCARDGRSHLCR